jgi:hypothetical protein
MYEIQILADLLKDRVRRNASETWDVAVGWDERG